MATKGEKTGKQPYIPLYIGDWEQDTNMLSLEAEGGWLKIIFKMFKQKISETPKNTKGLQGVYKISTKALQNLWRKSEKEINEIIEELKGANVCELEYCDGYYTFGNRRMIREGKISEIRSNAVQTRYKDGYKSEHPLEYEYEYDNEIDNETVLEGGSGETWKTMPSTDEMGLELNPVKGGAVVELFKFSKNHDLTPEELTLLWSIFKAQNFTGEKFYKSKNDVYSHFINWCKTQNVNGKSNSNTTKGNGSNYKTAGQDVFAENLRQKLAAFNRG